MRRGRYFLYYQVFIPHLLFDSIPFVRFDGQMSAKRRRDAINRFTVPLDREQSIPPRRNAGNGQTARDDGSYDSDPMIDDDDDFIDEDDKQVSGKRSKCKGKGKAKSTRSGSADEDENPRVMLLSLKAVCCLRIIMIS